MISEALNKLYKYCQKEKYKGWDNYDGLNSRILKNSPFYLSAFFRLAWIQFFKRFPINFRKIAFVSKGYNPKGLSLFVSGLMSLDKQSEARELINHLKEATCCGYAGICWGYNFDWQSRLFLIPSGTPNIVTTVFVANSLLDYFDKTKEKEKLNMAINSCEFILKYLVLFEDENTLCFAYVPGGQARVHNANMLGASFLARVYNLTGAHNYYEKSRKAMTYSINALRTDYSWPYGESKYQQFIDNFHTGFNLVALNNWMEYTGEFIWEEELKRAYDYFLNMLWLDNGCPKYYHNSLYPIDIHCSAQGIVTCLKLFKYNNQSIPLAKKIAKWAIENMQDEKGYFYYQKTKWFTNKIPYMRWAQAWMFYALSLIKNSD